MTYVISDIHGQAKLFNKLLKKINFNEKDKLYILGDAVDRGPDGIKILLKIMRTPNMYMLLGNHELMMYNTITAKNKPDMWEYSAIWFQNGGQITLKSFLKYSENTQKRILKYIKKLPSEFRIEINNKEFILCHAIPDPSSFKINPFENSIEGLRYDSEKEMAAWERYIRLDDKNFDNKIIIHGHTPTKLHDKEGKMTAAFFSKKGTLLSNAADEKVFEINIDSGCAYIPYGKNDGRLCCLRLEDMKLFYAQ